MHQLERMEIKLHYTSIEYSKRKMVNVQVVLEQ